MDNSTLWEKQKPKKVIPVNKFSVQCPTCGATILKLSKKAYCKCGQTLDWDI